MKEKHILVGHVGKEPEQRYTPTGQAVTTFSLATNRKWKNAQGDTVEETTWRRVVTWGHLAEFVGEKVKTGVLVYVEADREKLNQWTDREGKAQAMIEVTASDLTVLNWHTGKNSNPTGNNAPAYSDDHDDAPAAADGRVSF